LIVRSPRSASRTTFALNSPRCCRRDIVIVSFSPMALFQTYGVIQFLGYIIQSVWEQPLVFKYILIQEVLSIRVYMELGGDLLVARRCLLDSIDILYAGIHGRQ
jgi:hypothetical protein